MLISATIAAALEIFPSRYARTFACVHPPRLARREIARILFSVSAAGRLFFRDCFFLSLSLSLSQNTRERFIVTLAGDASNVCKCVCGIRFIIIRIPSAGYASGFLCERLPPTADMAKRGISARCRIESGFHGNETVPRFSFRHRALPILPIGKQISAEICPRAGVSSAFTRSGILAISHYADIFFFESFHRCAPGIVRSNIINIGRYRAGLARSFLNQFLFLSPLLPLLLLLLLSFPFSSAACVLLFREACRASSSRSDKVFE